MSRFPSDRHLASRTGICPGSHDSAGKHESRKTQKGNTWLRAALLEAALGATRTKNSAVAARYHRVLRHRGHKPTTTTAAIPNALPAEPCKPSSSRALSSHAGTRRVIPDCGVIF